MRFAHSKLSESQSSAGGSVALCRLAKPITGSTRLEPCELSRSEKRGGSRLASGVAINPLAKLGSISCTPRLAREEISIRHQTLFLKVRCRSKSMILSRVHCDCTVCPSADGYRQQGPSICSGGAAVTLLWRECLTRADTRVSLLYALLFLFGQEQEEEEKHRAHIDRTRVSVRVDERSQIGSALSSTAASGLSRMPW